MKNFALKSNNIVLRVTNVSDLEFILSEESREENARYVSNWTKKQHIDALLNPDMLHLVIEEIHTNVPVGYIIMAGIESENRNIEFLRIVISKKGHGYGRDALRLIKDFSFNSLNAHRLWLDVRFDNSKAQSLYKSEGFIQEGVLRDCILYKGQYESLIIMSMLRNEYFNL